MAPTVEKIGRYEIVSELGRGAMGLVYRAVDPNIGRTVALKTMRLDVHGMEHDEMLRRFRNEARAAGLMNHPNIVTIYDADEVDGLFYIAMEYMEGQTIQSLLMEKRVLPVEQIVEIATQVCAGLDYAHGMHVIHRDIKPANIMITSQNVAKIMDFGISKNVGSMTSSGQVLGTPNYMSPEQVKGNDLDVRADLFSFGVVLYEMATGERPFAGQNVTTIIYKIVNENPIPPSELEAGIHPGLSTIISRCLTKNPEERYQSGSALAKDLVNYRAIGCDGDATSILAGTPKPRAAGNSTGKSPAGAPTSPTAKHPATARVSGPGSGTVRRKSGNQATVTTTIGHRGRELKAAAVTVMSLAVVIAAASIYRIKHHLGAPIPTPEAQVAQAISVPVKQPDAQTAPQQEQDDRDAQADKPAKKPVAKKVEADSSDADDKEQAQSAPGKVRIRFHSNPEGAFLQIDGKSSEAWLTPLTMPDVTPGSHEVSFSKQGYATETRTLEIGPKNSSYSLDLVPVTTALSISSEPPGADIEIDGRDTTIMTPAQIPVAEGEHRILVRLDGYRSAQMLADVKKGQTFQFSPKLNPGDARQAGTTSKLGKIFGAGIRGGRGVIDFVTTPPGAKIFIQGRAAAIATPAHAPFPPGNYRVELREPGYKPVQRTVTVEPGKISKLEVTLDPQ